MSSISSNTSSAEVWKKIKLLSSKPRPRTIIIKESGNTISAPADIGNILANHFTSAGSLNPTFLTHKNESELLPILLSENSEDWYNQPFSLRELTSALSSCHSKTPGSDGVNYAMIKHMDNQQLKSLLSFYNYIFKEGFPGQWKVAITLPLPKPNKPHTSKQSYRPIALLNVLSKVVEKMVNRRLLSYLEKKNFFSSFQSGFRAGHSTLDSLSRLESDARLSILNRKFCLAVFLDISKAFDSVWHHGLLRKLSDTGVRGQMFNFIAGFLENRSTKVKVGTALSDSYDFSCGVPQGSVLGPSLFSIMINDIFDEVPASVNKSLYADDGAIWASSASLTDATSCIQAALRSVEVWSSKWGLDISSSKSSSIIFSLKKQTLSSPLVLNDISIPLVSSIRFLGIIFDSRLTWAQHISSLKAKCQSDLRLLSLVSWNNWGSDPNILRMLYMSLIRSKMDYGSFLFDEASRSNLILLDRIQFSACRIILEAFRSTPTYKLEVEANLMPLNIRRKLLMMQYACRISTVPSHPFAARLRENNSFSDLLAHNYMLPVSERANLEFSKIDISPSTVPVVRMDNRYPIIAPPINRTLSSYKKDDLSSSQWQVLHSSLCQSHSDRIPVYTDGSVRFNLSGCGVWSSDFSLIARLPNNSSIFTCELYAIYSAVSFLSHLPGKFILLTDSLSSVEALSSLNRPQHYLCRG